MPERQNRQLAAILFADIAGYTALMQKDEQSASTLLRRFQKEMEEKVVGHNGRIVNFYGDGALCTFNNPLEAVRCAMALQTNFQSSPSVPVRIGLHSGTVVFENEKIYGDSVNLASRIESMGVPGAILFSKKIRDDIKNQSDIKIKSLGKFAFKNVEEEMEVFALANEGFVVPKKEELKGKLKTKGKGRINIKVLFGLVLILALGLFFFKDSIFLTEGKDLIAEDIRKQRVAVAVFENQTGKEDLNTLGYLAAEWITIGFREMDVKIVSPEVVREYQDKIGVTLNNKEGKISYQELTGAQYVINGSYFLANDSIQLMTRLVNTSNGEQVQNFKTFRCSLSEKEKLVQNVRSHILGYWGNRSQLTHTENSPPNYEAYQAYMKAIEKGVPGDPHWQKEAIRRDSNFILPYIYLLQYYFWTEGDSLYSYYHQQLESKWSQLTEYERLRFEAVHHFRNYEYGPRIKILERLYSKYPDDYLIAHELAWSANGNVNAPARTIEVYNRFFTDRKITDVPVMSNVLDNYADAYNRLGFPDSALMILSQVHPDILSWEGNYYRNAINSLALKNDWEGLQEILTDILNSKKFNQWEKKDHANKCIQWYAYFNSTDPVSDNPFVEIAAAFHEKNDLDKSNFYYAIGEYDSVLIAMQPFWEAYRNAIAADTFNPMSGSIWTRGWEHELWLKSMTGQVAAHQGDSIKSLEMIQSIEQARQIIGSKIITPFQRGQHFYEQAKIYAVLGEKEKAVNLLKQAVADGKLFIWDAFHFDLNLIIPLKGYPPFEEFLESETNHRLKG